MKTAVKFRNLMINKILSTDTNKLFPISFKAIYISLRYTQFEKQFRSNYIRLLVWEDTKIFLNKCF